MRNSGADLFQARRELLGRDARRRLPRPPRDPRRGLSPRHEAVLRGAGDGFILGCNHPIWPSFGLIHGSRSSGDIKRTWEISRRRRARTSPQLAERPALVERSGCGTLSGDLPTTSFASTPAPSTPRGGMVLSGDDLSSCPAASRHLQKAPAAHRRRGGVRRRVVARRDDQLKDRAMLSSSIGTTRR